MPPSGRSLAFVHFEQPEAMLAYTTWNRSRTRMHHRRMEATREYHEAKTGCFMYVGLLSIIALSLPAKSFQKKLQS